VVVDEAAIRELANEGQPGGEGPQGAVPTGGAASRPGAGPTIQDTDPSGPVADLPPDIARVMKIHVPVTVRLARRPLTVGAIRKFSVGLILEFSQSVDEPLELLVSNQRIGAGETVRIGENYGLRITHIHDHAARLRMMSSKPVHSVPTTRR
jgi:flagellar motor switch protein FliN/FliY